VPVPPSCPNLFEAQQYAVPPVVSPQVPEPPVERARHVSLPPRFEMYGAVFHSPPPEWLGAVAVGLAPQNIEALPDDVAPGGQLSPGKTGRRAGVLGDAAHRP